MKRERAMFPWELYWQNKKYKPKRSLLLFSKKITLNKTRKNHMYLDKYIEAAFKM